MISADALAVPLDGLRRRGLRLARRNRALAYLQAHRDARLAVQAAAGVTVAFALAVAAPLLLLAVSPILLGVPHLASDVRYLVVRPRFARRAKAALVAVCAAVLALRLVEAAGGGAWPRVELGAVTALTVAAVGTAAARAQRWWRGLGVALGAVALGALAIPHAATARLAFAHLHNVLALVVWMAVFRRRAWAALPAVTLAAVGVALLLSGATLPWSARAGGLAAAGIDLAGAARWLAPGVAPSLAAALVVTFAFLQGVHYAVWLGWIPQEPVRGEGTLSFRMSLRALTRDFGRSGLVLVVALQLAILLAAACGLTRTRELYLSVASFHGYLELTALALFAVGAPAPT